MARLILLLACIAALALGALPASAQDAEPHPTDNVLPERLKSVGFDQRLNNQIPGDIGFTDEAGRKVELGEFINRGKPVIVTMNYYECPTLCPVQLDTLMASLEDVKYEIGKDFTVVSVSVDPEETPKLARGLEQKLERRSTKPELAEGWAFLTGSAGSIRALANDLGVGYAYDPKHDEYLHPAGLTMLTPQGKVSRYLFGIDYTKRDIEFGLLESSQGKVGNLVDKIMIRCYRYDPTNGRYGPFALGLVRLGGIVTLLSMGTYMGVMWRRDAHRGRLEANESTGEGR